MTLYRLCFYLLVGVCIFALVVLSIAVKDMDYFSGISELIWSAAGVYAGYWLSVRWNKIQIQKEKKSYEELSRAELLRSLNMNLSLLNISKPFLDTKGIATFRLDSASLSAALSKMGGLLDEGLIKDIN